MGEGWGWRIVRIVAAALAGIGAAGCGALILFVAADAGGPLGVPLLGAALGCGLAVFVLPLGLLTGPGRGLFRLAAAGLLVAAAILLVVGLFLGSSQGTNDYVVMAVGLALLALITPWWAPE